MWPELILIMAGAQTSIRSRRKADYRARPSTSCYLNETRQQIKLSGSDAMNIQDNSRYHEVHARSLRDPEGFWAEAAREIDWIEPAKKVFDPAMGLYGRWFTGAVVNTC